MILAQDGDVGDDVHWRDISSKDDNTGGSSNIIATRRFSEGLDDFLDTSLEGLVLGRCMTG